MESLFILIPLSIIAVGVALFFFLRMNSTGQFEDSEGPAWNVILDDDSTSGISDENQSMGTGDHTS